MAVQRRERSQPQKERASDCGVRGAGGDRKRGASGERLEGRDREKNCYSGEKGKKKELYKRRKGVQHKDFPGGYPSEYYSRLSTLNFEVLMGFGAEGSQPRRDRASDCGVRGAGDVRKRRASGERLEGRDRGKNCFSGEKGKKKKKIVQKEKGVQHKDFPGGQPS
ncbi:Hypothetical predicted protein [Olea europaea subsp. europaea]|uniref:Uncharacterized protein n=1 Tax=Olea europaea subsp. europaea TaxID=158383 RepID=A0A8S0RR13_OLEEU|nr:Hypothetical predicted protein [Olea europaea subsp. europaea]